MKRKDLFPILLAALGLAAIGGYILYGYLGPEERLPQEKREIESESGAPQDFEPKVEEELAEAEEGTKHEKEIVASAPFEDVALISDNESDTQQFPEVPTDSEPSELMEVSSAESKTSPEVQVLESSGHEELGLAQNSEPTAESGQESTEEEAPTIVLVEEEQPEGNPTTIQRSAIALGVEGREPQGICESVSVQQGRVYCWLHVKDAEGRKVIIRWIANGEELWETELSVGSGDWRTWAYITLRPSIVGPAQADILNEEGELLKTESFEITE